MHETGKARSGSGCEDPTPRQAGGRILVRATTEYGRLRTVAMSLASPQAAGDRRARPFDWVRARDEQLAVAELLESLGARVLFADKPADARAGGHHLVRDAGFVVGEAFFVSRLRCPRSRLRLSGVRRLLPRLSAVEYLEEGAIGGADVMLDRDRVIVGVGGWTDGAGAGVLAGRLAALGADREVLAVRMRSPGRLDSVFNLVAPNLALVFAEAIEPKDLARIRADYDAVELTREEVEDGEAGVVAVGPGVVAVHGRSTRIASELGRRGVVVIPVGYSEMAKIGGTLRNTALPLARTP